MRQGLFLWQDSFRIADWIFSCYRIETVIEVVLIIWTDQDCNGGCCGRLCLLSKSSAGPSSSRSAAGNSKDCLQGTHHHSWMRNFRSYPRSNWWTQIFFSSDSQIILWAFNGVTWAEYSYEKFTRLMPALAVVCQILPSVSIIAQMNQIALSINVINGLQNI